MKFFKFNVHKKMGFFKKFCVLALGFCLTFQSVAAFDGPTHRFVTESALKEINKLGDEKFSKVYAGYDKLMSDYSVKPDEDENGPTTAPYLYHFYNYATGVNYLGEKTSALTKFTSHYENAKQLYREGKILEAIQELSRALHFYEDLSTAVHTFYESLLDATRYLKMHTDLEKKCNEIISDGFKSPEVSKQFLEKFNCNDVRSIGIDAAQMSSDNLSAYYLNEHISDLKACENIISNAIYGAAGLMFKFATECTNSSGNVIVRGDQ